MTDMLGYTGRQPGHILLLALATSLALAAACDAAGGGPVEPSGAVVRITAPDTVLSSIGDTLRLEWTVQSASGALLTADPVEWRSSDPAVATVHDGVVVARGSGAAILGARAGGGEASIAVRVTQAPADLVLDAAEFAIAGPGGSVALHAAVRDRRGHAIRDVPLAWSSSHPRRIAVDPRGVATAGTFGSATIAVEGGGFTRSALVRVTGGGAPELENIRAGITRVGTEAAVSYVVIHAALRDAERDMDSLHVTLLDAAGAAVLRHRRVLAQGAETLPLSLHAAAAYGVTQALVEAFDAAGNRGVRVLTLRESPNARSPRIDDVLLRRAGADSVHLELDASDPDADVEVIWLVGFDAAGGWTLVEGLPVDVDGLTDWYAEFGFRHPALARTHTLGVMLMDRVGNLSAMQRLALGGSVGTAGALRPSGAAAEAAAVRRDRPTATVADPVRTVRPVVARPRGR